MSETKESKMRVGIAGDRIALAFVRGNVESTTILTLDEWVWLVEQGNIVSSMIRAKQGGGN